MTLRESALSRDEPRTAMSLLGGIVRVVHPFPSFLVSAVVLALVPLANSSAPPVLYVRLGLGMLCYQFAIGIVNDLVDARDDATAKPGKPIASGAVTVTAATFLAIALAVIGAMVTFGLPFEAWLVGLAGLSCGLTYDIWLKRTWWSWLPFAIALPLVPTWVWSATGQWESHRAWVLPLGALLGLSVHLANQSPDIADDRALGVRGLAQRIGERSRAISVALFALPAVAAAALLARESALAAGGALAIGIIAAAASPFAPRLFGRDGLFGLLAVATGALAFVFLAAA